MKTNLISILKAAFVQAKPLYPKLDNINKTNQLHPFSQDRRDILRQMGQAGLLLSVQSPTTLLPNLLSDKHGAKIAIVGAGMAGLSAGYHFRRKNIVTNIFEAGSRAGGRIKSAHHFGEGTLTTEIGAEFIDSAHNDMLWYAKAFGLWDNIIDVEMDKHGIRDVFFIEGKQYRQSDIVAELNPIYAIIDKDIQRGDSKKGDLLDNQSLAQYIESLPISKWLKQMLNAAFIGENGLDTEEQSALNFLQVFGTEKDKFKPFGSSDERFKIRGGNDQIPSKLSEILKDQILFGHRLLSIKEMADDRVKLTFSTNGKTYEDIFDAVIMTIPFTVLRDVDIQANLSDVKKRVIKDLGYGTNTKFILETNQRIWRTQQNRGFLFNERAHNGWDSSQGQLDNTGTGTYTVYYGGTQGRLAASGTENDQLAHVSPALNGMFPGFSNALTGKMELAHWTSNPNIKGSYSCFKPGQVLGFEGISARREGRIYFAGEHCSEEYWGFMNGAAETGRKAAEALLKKIRR